MRIAVVHSFYTSRQPSGENSAVQAQVDLLRRAGHEVLLIARRTDDERQRPLYSVRAALAASSILGPDPSDHLRAFQPDLVHVHNLFPNWGAGWLKEWGHKTVATLHNYRSVCAGGTLWRDGQDCQECLTKTSLSAVRHACYRDSRLATLPLAWATRAQGSKQPGLKAPAAIIVLNDAAKRLFSSRTSAAVVKVPNFVERVERVMPSPDWLYVGRLSQEKGVLELARSFPSGRRLNIVGDGPLARDIRGIAERRADSVRFLGPRSHSETLGQIAKARGLIVSSLCSEGIPTVALEALSAGTPLLISGRVSVASELTSSGAGLTYDPLKMEQLGAAMDRIDKEHSSFRSASRHLYEHDYSPEAWLKAISSVYGRVAAGITAQESVPKVVNE